MTTESILSREFDHKHACPSCGAFQAFTVVRIDSVDTSDGNTAVTGVLKCSLCGKEHKAQATWHPSPVMMETVQTAVLALGDPWGTQ